MLIIPPKVTRWGHGAINPTDTRSVLATRGLWVAPRGISAFSDPADLRYCLPMAISLPALERSGDRYAPSLRPDLPSAPWPETVAPSAGAGERRIVVASPTLHLTTIIRLPVSLVFAQLVYLGTRISGFSVQELVS